MNNQYRNIRLRELEEKDCDYILEWMNDREITGNLKLSDLHIQRKDILNFIENSINDSSNMHFAIVSEDDEYLGTISLKNINKKDENAEYAIVLRKTAIGMNIARHATDLVLNKAFSELKLSKIYLTVTSGNTRAVKFYQKYGFIQEGYFKSHIKINNQFHDLMWFAIQKNSFMNKKIN